MTAVARTIVPVAMDACFAFVKTGIRLVGAAVSSLTAPPSAMPGRRAIVAATMA